MKRKLPLTAALALMTLTAVYLMGCEDSSCDDGLHTDDEVLVDVPVTNNNMVVYTTSHDNLVEFVRYLSLSSVTYAFDGQYCITSGQPWDGISSSESDGSCTLDVKAGRNKTSGPAQWFKNRATMAMCVSGSWLGWPSSLNFAFNGTITIDGNSYQLVVGQGNDGMHNNWWIGGMNWGSDTVSLITPDKKYCITQLDVSFNQFYVQPY
jgi:hypothetical protein